MATAKHHGDGEVLPSETLHRLELGRCQHCHDGLMLSDPYDAGVSTCSTCGRNDFRASAEVLADVGQGKLSCSESHIHGRGNAVNGKGQELGIPTGSVNAVIRRFA